MNWEAIGASAELLAAVGVIISLLYLAAQIRQNTASVRASTFQAFTNESAETARLGLLNQDLMAEFTSILLNETKFEPGRHVRFGVAAGLYARNLQFGFLELQGGRIDRRQFDSYVAYHAAHWMCLPGWRDWWELNREHYDSDFVAWLEARLAV
jgi:hypothetical protein